MIQFNKECIHLKMLPSSQAGCKCSCCSTSMEAHEWHVIHWKMRKFQCSSNCSRQQTPACHRSYMCWSFKSIQLHTSLIVRWWRFWCPSIVHHRQISVNHPHFMLIIYNLQPLSLWLVSWSSGSSAALEASFGGCRQSDPDDDMPDWNC